MSLYFDEDEAVSKLRELGYRVSKPDLSEFDTITNIKSLVEFFYARRTYYNSDRRYPLSIDYKEDTRAISSFVKSREKLGLGRKAAVQEAALLIDALFKYEKHLYLKGPIINLGIVNVRPLMDRVCTILNGEMAEISEEENENFVKEINEIYNKRFNQRDFDLALEERKLILEKLNDEEGK